METSYLLAVLMALSGLSVADAECCPPSFPQPPPRPPGVTERYVCDSGPDIDMSRWSKAAGTTVTALNAADKDKQDTLTDAAVAKTETASVSVLQALVSSSPGPPGAVNTTTAQNGSSKGTVWNSSVELYNSTSSPGAGNTSNTSVDAETAVPGFVAAKENTGVTVGVAVTLCVLILMLTGAAVGYKLYKRRYSSTKIGPRGLKVEDNFLFNFRLRGIKFKPRSDKEEDPDKLSKEQVTPESPDEHKDRLSIGSSSSGIGSIHSDVHEDDAHQMEPQSLPADMVIGMHHLPPIHQNLTDPPRKQDQATTHHPAVLLDPKLLGDASGKNAVFDSISRPPSEQMKLGLKGQSNFFRREPDETVQKKYIQHKDPDDNITYDTVVVKKEAYGESDA